MIKPRKIDQNGKIRSLKISRPKTKQDQLVQMLRRPEGATTTAMSKHLCWQRHSVRGAISVSLKRLGHHVTRRVVAGGERTYRIEK